MRPAGVDITGVVEGFDALAGEGIGSANGWHAVEYGDAVRAGVGAKVMVERAVLLHDDDNVLELQPGEGERGGDCGGGERGRENGGSGWV